MGWLRPGNACSRAGICAFLDPHMTIALRRRLYQRERRASAPVDTPCRRPHHGLRLMAKARTVRELRDSGWRSRSVKHELRDNLVARLRKGETLLPGIVGYDDSVVPQIENAILSGQDIIFLGERGQAKTRIARQLVNLLDDEMPAMAGCEDRKSV